MLPIMIQVSGRRVVVIGGGSVGQRKARNCYKAGAVVTVIEPSPQPREEIPTVEWISEPYRKEHLIGAEIVFASATPEVNKTVVKDARSLGILVNSSTDPVQGDFLVPAIYHRGKLQIAVSTTGASPALARRIRDRIAEFLDQPFEIWLMLLEEIRQKVLQEIPDPATRARLLDQFAEWSWLDRLQNEGADAVRSAMSEVVLHHIPERSSSPGPV